ncbi:hypothetical protein NITLEN_80084 [Nitrospira lenta]|uniref:Uncharacterized protein n=1 Tax=Nitrospira lenta TaxID=1436998 RepID=A0A330L9M3_9BACT|nr:hypothetical protein NITLEN_80084 [Nitrospira lenta]
MVEGNSAEDLGRWARVTYSTRMFYVQQGYSSISEVHAAPAILSPICSIRRGSIRGVILGRDLGLSTGRPFRSVHRP